MSDERSKVTTRHLKLKAYVYVRQSTMKQVILNKESTLRQYDLTGRARALGWAPEQIITVDCDLGRSGASSERAGFMQLVSEVGLGHAGIVLGLEVSRLARDSADWHQLIRICALNDTLLLDEDGLYDPSNFNDRLLLGLKGTMSEAELHVLRSRMRGALVAKAKRGELRFLLPVGFVHDLRERIVLDPDVQVQAAVRLFFQTFARLGAVHATVKHFRTANIPFPSLGLGTPNAGKLTWDRLSFAQALGIVKNPIYAGAYVFGRRRSRLQPDGRRRTVVLPRDEWITLRRDAHPGYISWEEFERNQNRVRENALAVGADHRTISREGPALLQGLILCGKCGRRMLVQYHQRQGQLVQSYVCGRRKHAEPFCQTFNGEALDAAVSRLLLDKVTPAALDMSIAVRDEIQSRSDDAHRIREQAVIRAQYEADLARRRFMQVDPDNRLVAQSLEADWNERLRAVAAARELCDRERRAEAALLEEKHCARIRALATEFPAIWNDHATPCKERKRIAALLIEDVTVTRHTCLTAQVRFRGGASTTVSVPSPLTAIELWVTPKETIAQIEQLLEENTHSQAVAILNERNLTTGPGQPFSAQSLAWVCNRYGIASLRTRLRAKGMLTVREVSKQLGVGLTLVRGWGRSGQLKARVCNDKGERLYYPLASLPAAMAQSSSRSDGSAARGAV